MAASRTRAALGIAFVLVALPLAGCATAPAITASPRAASASPTPDASPTPSAEEIAAATSALLDAAARDDRATVAEAIDAGADLESRDSSG
ncbi:MAG: hypothetical protein ACRDMZ_20110, partial [Solirubrobacteraceae bacterium]